MRSTRTKKRDVRRAAALALLLATACASPPPPPPPPAPRLDAEPIALRLEGETELHEPVRIFFTWSMSDRDARFQGRGVARIEPPYKARLDLFLGSGETVARAALVGDELRLPPGAPQGVIPPAEMLWATLGVFRPGMNIELLGAEQLPDGRTRLRYRRPDGVDLRYTVRGQRIEEIERLRGGTAVERVTLTAEAADRYPSQATYRDLAAFRELKLTRERVEQVEAFPPDIWEVGP
jgi:hypothetical protein